MNPCENNAVQRYFRRARWAFLNATNGNRSIESIGNLLAMAVHACQSLSEAIDLLKTDDAQFKTDASSLKFKKLIESMRNMDIHGSPIPICELGARRIEMVTKPDHPIQLTSTNNTEVGIRMNGIAPEIRRFPKNLKNATVDMGILVSWACVNGKMIVFDFSTRQEHLIQDVVQMFLEACSSLLSKQPK